MTEEKELTMEEKVKKMEDFQKNSLEFMKDMASSWSLDERMDDDLAFLDDDTPIQENWWKHSNFVHQWAKDEWWDK